MPDADEEVYRRLLNQLTNYIGDDDDTNEGELPADAALLAKIKGSQ